MNQQPIQSILIVGGGTAGWLTAAYLARQLGTLAGGVRITLVESPEIGIIGVGEGTFPSIRRTLARIGIKEAEFLSRADASFKQGIRYDHWVREPGKPGPDHYFHPFAAPTRRSEAPELLPYWLLGAAGGTRADRPFAAAGTLQKAAADASRGPKKAVDPDYQGMFNYAYHFDAARFAGLLAEHGRALGVQHLQATVERVELDETGAIAGVHTREAGMLSAGLYIDCTGFRAALIGAALGSPWVDCKDTLFADRAVALQVPYADARQKIASYTIATAQECGWTWDIGLQERRGVGYVYSSRYTDDTRAEEVLRRHIGPAAQGLEARQLKLKVGYREACWVKNCVAVGLSGGFVEPLESSGIGLIETAAYFIAHLFPADGNLAPAARHFNGFMKQRYERIIDFIKLHYCLSQRQDTPFWTDNTRPETIPERLREQLAMWKTRAPNPLDFLTDVEMYPPWSWQYVLYGMEYDTQLPSAAPYPRRAEAEQEFATLARLGPVAAKELPDHRELIEALAAR